MLDSCPPPPPPQNILELLPLESWEIYSLTLVFFEIIGLTKKGGELSELFSVSWALDPLTNIPESVHEADH